MTDWPEPVRRVASFLQEAAAEARIEEFPAGTPTALAAAEAVGCELSRIVKSLLFRCDGRPLLVLVPGDRRADPRKIATAARAERARVAGPDDVRDVTGFEPGAVAPFALRGVEDVLVDGALVVDGLLWVGAGSTTHLAGVGSAELLRLTRGRTVDVAEDA